MEFKKGDNVAYKSKPEICIGSIAQDNSVLDFLSGKQMYRVYTSDDWFKYFAPYGGPNSIGVAEDEIVLYKD